MIEEYMRGYTRDFYTLPWTLKEEDGTIVQTHENLMFLEHIGQCMYGTYDGVLEMWQGGKKVYTLKRPLCYQKKQCWNG